MSKQINALLTPWKIGDLKIKNRVILTSVEVSL